MTDQISWRWHTAVPVGVLAAAAATTTLLDLFVLDVWVPEALGFTIALGLLALWTTTRSTWAPAVAGLLALLATAANLASPFVYLRLFDPADTAFFLVTWIATIAGLTACPIGLAATVVRRRHPPSLGALESRSPR